MACDTIRSPQQTAEDRRREIDAALVELETRLASGRVSLRVSPEGAVCFDGWAEERRGVTDACAFLTLSQRDSWELRQAVAREQALSGRTPNVATVSAGVHSHDGGRTWGAGH